MTLEELIKDINQIFKSRNRDDGPDRTVLLEQVKSILRQIDIGNSSFMGHKTFTICHDDIAFSDRLRCLHIKIREKKEEEPPSLSKDFDQLLTETQKKYHDNITLEFDDYELIGIHEKFIYTDELQSILDQMPDILKYIRDDLEGKHEGNPAYANEDKRRWKRRQFILESQKDVGPPNENYEDWKKRQREREKKLRAIYED